MARRRRAPVALLLPRLAAAGGRRADLGLGVELRRRAISSYTPRPDGSGLLGRAPDAAAARRLARVLRDDRARRPARLPDAHQPLPSRAALRAEVAEDPAWEALFERPLGEAVEAAFDDDVERGIVLTDGADRHVRRARTTRRCARTAASSTT